MVDLLARRDEIATALTGISGLRPVQDEGLLPDKLNLPTCTIAVADDRQPMNLTLSEAYEHFEVVLIHSLRAGRTRAERSLGALHDDVWEALVAAPSVIEVNRQGYGLIEVQGVEVLGAIFRLEVIDQ